MVKKEKPEDISPELREKLKEVEDKADKRTPIRKTKGSKDLQDKLELSPRIKRLKDIEKKVFYPQIVGIILLFPIILYLRGATLSPFYSPLVYPLLMVFIWTLILCIEGFVFRMMEIKHHPSKSAKFVMAKNSIQKAIPIVVIALIVFSLLYTPYLTEEIEARTSIEDTTEIRGLENITLVSKGRFGFRAAKNLRVECISGEADVSLHEKETGLALFENESLTVTEDHTYDDFREDGFQELILSFNSTGEAEMTRVEYELDMKIQEDIRYPFAAVSFVYLGVFTEWTLVQYPIKKKYGGVGIYQ